MAYDNYMTVITHHTPTYYRVRTVVRFLFWVTVATGSFLVGKALTHNSLSYSCDGQDVIVNAGESLWSIAEQHCDGHIGKAVFDLVGIYGTTVYAGQVISLDIEREY